MVFMWPQFSLVQYVLRASSFWLTGPENAPFNTTGHLDHSWITSYTSLGDSYSVGLGAGHAIEPADSLVLNPNCSQFSYGYPNILNADAFLGPNPDRKFRYLGCSGARAPEIRDNQVPSMGKAQLVTLSAGGNDADLATVLNYCVFQWWTTFGWNCTAELDKVERTISSTNFTNDLKSLVDAITPNLQDENSRIYWVGYERFFDTSTKACDNVTWSFMYNYGTREFLTQTRRRTMNQLVDSVNEKIKAVCDRTERCVFVNNTDSIAGLKGYFCEPGVDETYAWPDGGASANREETWPYEWGTTKDDDAGEDNNADEPLTESLAPISIYDNSTFEATIAWYISQGLIHGTIDPVIAEAAIGGRFTAQGTWLPTRYGRVFHLTKNANGQVALNVLKAMDAEQAKITGKKISPGRNRDQLRLLPGHA